MLLSGPQNQNGAFIQLGFASVVGVGVLLVGAVLAEAVRWRVNLSAMLQKACQNQIMT